MERAEEGGVKRGNLGKITIVEEHLRGNKTQWKLPKIYENRPNEVSKQ